VDKLRDGAKVSTAGGGNKAPDNRKKLAGAT
jgi:hypothetical protein